MYRKLVVPESHSLTYDQMGADYYTKTDQTISGGYDYTEYIAYIGGTTIDLYQANANNPAGYWIGIQNLSDAGEVLPVQGKAVGEWYYEVMDLGGGKQVGDDLAIDEI